VVPLVVSLDSSKIRKKARVNETPEMVVRFFLGQELMMAKRKARL